ncbi:MAG: SHOCT domain-containing protein [Deltaproteobacteria bacterium]|nr:SHOCT domain-containing protein [Deltaproteobacteria bacterium]
MERRMYVRIAWCALFLSFTAAAGCGGTAVLNRANEISVASDPSGAAVTAAGKRIGVTPLVIRQQDVFPVVFPPENQDAYGTLVISKEGCKDHTVRVTNEVIRKGVNAKLDCGQSELVKPRAGAPAAPPPAIRERLLRLNELRDQGLITADEYKEIRAKILGEL